MFIRIKCRKKQLKQYVDKHTNDQEQAHTHTHTHTHINEHEHAQISYAIASDIK